MNTTINFDIESEIAALRAAASEPKGLRELQNLELGWVSGGDGPVGWNNPPPPP